MSCTGLEIRSELKERDAIGTNLTIWLDRAAVGDLRLLDAGAKAGSCSICTGREGCICPRSCCAKIESV